MLQRGGNLLLDTQRLQASRKIKSGLNFSYRRPKEETDTSD